MSMISSNALPEFDKSSEGFTSSARDVGEVIAYLAGGLRPDLETLSRLSLSLRGLREFLIEEAEEQAGREAVAEDLVLAQAVRQVVRPVTLPDMPVKEVAHA